MDRREFLKFLGLSGLVIASPKFIFDLGANISKYPVFPEIDGYIYFRAVEAIPQYSVVMLKDHTGRLLNVPLSTAIPIGVSQCALSKGQWGYAYCGPGPTTINCQATLLL